MKVSSKSFIVRRRVLTVVVVLLLFGNPAPSEANSEMCEFSDTRPTVVIDGCETGVDNIVDESNCTIADNIVKCAVGARNHGAFVRCVGRLANDLKKRGIISGKEKGRIESCAARADFPGSGYDLVAVEEPFQFEFEKAADPLSVAMQKIHAVYKTTPSPETDMIELENIRQQAAAHLRDHPLEAAEALLGEAALLGSWDSRLVSIIHLLGYFESEGGVAYLHGLLQDTVPMECSYVSGEVDETNCLEVHVIRLSAIESLGRISEIGSAFARDQLLSLVSHPDKSIRRKAVELFYENSGMPRWRAQNELERQLPPSERYLLFEIY